MKCGAIIKKQHKRNADVEKKNYEPPEGGLDLVTNRFLLTKTMAGSTAAQMSRRIILRTYYLQFCFMPSNRSPSSKANLDYLHLC